MENYLNLLQLMPVIGDDYEKTIELSRKEDKK
jgi:hypothetical protein